ncbi:MAG TPA: DUF420 domain-containing protein [Candidatus Binataceae bacterium]|nr:DUF420 domain-containing protein [Candidatus Binataceae bacterium]
MIPYSLLPRLNAILNSTAAVLLAAGFVFIKRKNVPAHRLCMLGALAVSVLFLASYLTFHAHAGEVRFGGSGWIRPVYFTILVPHVILAITIVPLALITASYALRGRFASHRRIARWTWPLWMYVSVTGVVIYFLLYVIYTPIMP